MTSSLWLIALVLISLLSQRLQWTVTMLDNAHAGLSHSRQLHLIPVDLKKFVNNDRV